VITGVIADDLTRIDGVGLSAYLGDTTQYVTFGPSVDGLTEHQRCVEMVERWRASDTSKAGAGDDAQPRTASAHHLNDGATIKHNGKRLRRRHRERFGAMIGEGYWNRDATMLTLTMDEATAADPELARVWNSVLTSIGARLRRAGVTGRVTASEKGKLTDRSHRHVVGDMALQDVWGYLLKHGRGFRKFARNWEPDEGALKAMLLQRRWEQGQWRGSRRPKFARTYQELVVSRYLGRGSIGWVDVLGITGKAAVGYCLKYAGKGGGRVSYSRPAGAAWANGAKLLVYAYDGQMMRYPRRKPEWVVNEIGRLDRRDARRRHDQQAIRAAALPAIVSAMVRHEEYRAMTTANELHFQASNLHATRAAAYRYRVEEIETPGMEREAITSADEGEG